MNSSVYWISWLHLSAASHFWRKSTNHFWASINEKSLRLIDFLLEINVMFSSCVSVYCLNETDRGEEWPDTGYYKYFPKNWQNERNEARMKSMEWNRRKMNATFEFHFSCHSVTVICYLLCDSNWQLVDCFFFFFCALSTIYIVLCWWLWQCRFSIERRWDSFRAPNIENCTLFGWIHQAKVLRRWMKLGMIAVLIQKLQFIIIILSSVFLVAKMTRQLKNWINFKRFQHFRSIYIRWKWHTKIRSINAIQYSTSIIFFSAI